MARVHHPDRVSDSEKFVAIEKFAIIHHAYQILSDPMQRQQYDNGSGVLFAKATKSDEWEYFLRPTTDTELNNVCESYQNSIKEQNDIEQEFI